MDGTHGFAIRSIELARAALAIAEQVLARGGKFFEKFVGEVREKFELVKVSKPPASRKGSAEVYIVAKGLNVTQTPS